MTDSERIAVLETEMKNLTTSVGVMGIDVRAIRDTLMEVKGGWKLFMLVGGFGAAIGAILGKLLAYIKF